MKKKFIYTSIIVVVAALMIVSIALASTSFARYKTQNEQIEGAQVATFKITEDQNFTKTFNWSGIFPGSEKNWSFNIVSESDVAVEYKAIIESTNNLPLTFIIKCDSVEVSPDSICKVAPNDTTAHNITFTARWLETPENYDLKYANRVELIKFTLVAEHID